MANQTQVEMLLRDVKTWNTWRTLHPKVKINLYRAKLSGAQLHGADLHAADLREASLDHAELSYANLRRANLSESILLWSRMYKADLRDANLEHANLAQATLADADLRLAKLRQANLSLADLNITDLSQADLTEADLRGAILVGTKLKGANLNSCRVFGVSAWMLDLNETSQENLIITHDQEPTITVSNLNVAQFIYLLLNNAEVRHVIDTVTSKVVLILGRFTPERKVVLDAVRDALRRPPFDYVPVMFDFDKPASKGYTETVNTLANLARFVIADITDVKVVLQELDLIVKNHPSVPVQPILLAGEPKNVILTDFEKYRSYLPLYEYPDGTSVIAALADKVITPAEQMVRVQRGERTD